MERFDRKSWSDEEGFWGAVQEFVEDQGSPRGEDDGVVRCENQGDDMMEEFILDSSFEEWTRTFLGRESFGCGKKSVEEDTGAGSCAASQTRTREASKDDLGGFHGVNG